MKELARAMPVIGEYIPTMQPTYATFEEVMEAHGGRTFADIKYDGYRVQVHKKKHDLKIFTRNGNELNYACYPDIAKIVENLPTCIIDAELVGEGNSHKEVFDNVKKRFRREGISDKAVERYVESGIIASVPLGLKVFDTLRLGNRNLLDTPLEDRRKYTERFDAEGISPSETELVTGVAALESLANRTFDDLQEGRVCKNPSSLYLSGQKTIDWVKFKRSETLDLVVVGFYREEEYAGDLPFTSVLVAAYNDAAMKYETVGKVGTTRDGIAADILGQLKGKQLSSAPDNVILSDKLQRSAYGKFVPQSYVEPESSVVLEVRALNLDFSDNWQTCGLESGKAFSMRIGYAHQLRPDKGPTQATTTDTIRKLYRLQKGDAQ